MHTRAHAQKHTKTHNHCDDNRYSQASTQAYATGAVILQRLCSSTPAPLFLHSRSFQRLLIVAFMLAAKLYDDIYLSNKVWAKIGGISVSEINDLELVFLKALGWSAAVPVSLTPPLRARTLLPLFACSRILVTSPARKC